MPAQKKILSFIFEQLLTNLYFIVLALLKTIRGLFGRMGSKMGSFLVHANVLKTDLYHPTVPIKTSNKKYSQW